MIDSDMAKYRWRTRIRMRLPMSVAHLVRKGPKDCGDHEWYRSEPGTWRCAHCRVGVTHAEPWSPIEALEVKLGGLRSTVKLAEYRPLSARELETATRLADEADASLHEIQRTLGNRADQRELVALARARRP